MNYTSKGQPDFLMSTELQNSIRQNWVKMNILNIYLIIAFVSVFIFASTPLPMPPAIHQIIPFGIIIIFLMVSIYTANNMRAIQKEIFELLIISLNGKMLDRSALPKETSPITKYISDWMLPIKRIQDCHFLPLENIHKPEIMNANIIWKSISVHKAPNMLFIWLQFHCSLLENVNWVIFYSPIAFAWHKIRSTYNKMLSKEWSWEDSIFPTYYWHIEWRMQQLPISLKKTIAEIFESTNLSDSCISIENWKVTFHTILEASLLSWGFWCLFGQNCIQELTNIYCKLQQTQNLILSDEFINEIKKVSIPPEKFIW